MHLNLTHTAAQMWNLAINLPVMIGHKIPIDDDNWECFLLLIDIVRLCTSRVATTAHAGILAALIHDHHHQFARCYPGKSITPKLYYMVHFALQIIRYILYTIPRDYTYILYTYIL